MSIEHISSTSFKIICKQCGSDNCDILINEGGSWCEVDIGCRDCYEGETLYER